MAKDHYTPSEIRYTKAQVLWLLRHLLLICSGFWPPQTSGYNIDAGIRGGHSSHAPFETPIAIGAELTDRLEKCGIDGLILVAIECWGMSPESLSKYFRSPVWVINKRRKRALRYVASGPVRRWQDTKKRRAISYEEFKRR